MKYTFEELLNKGYSISQINQITLADNITQKEMLLIPSTRGNEAFRNIKKFVPLNSDSIQITLDYRLSNIDIDIFAFLLDENGTTKTNNIIFYNNIVNNGIELTYDILTINTSKLNKEIKNVLIGYSIYNGKKPLIDLKNISFDILYNDNEYKIPIVNVNEEEVMTGTSIELVKDKDNWNIRFYEILSNKPLDGFAKHFL